MLGKAGQELLVRAQDVEPRKPEESDHQYFRRLESLHLHPAGSSDGEVYLLKPEHYGKPAN